MNRTLTFIFSRRRALGSTLIRAGSWWGQWSHCGLLTESETVDESLAIKGGVVRSTLAEVMRRSSAVEVIDLPVLDAQAALTWSNETIGAPYDWGGVFAIPFRERNWQDDSRWYCSERCAMQAKKAGVDLVSPDQQGVSPTALYRLMYAAGGRPPF